MPISRSGNMEVLCDFATVMQLSLELASERPLPHSLTYCSSSEVPKLVSGDQSPNWAVETVVRYVYKTR